MSAPQTLVFLFLLKSPLLRSVLDLLRKSAFSLKYAGKTNVCSADACFPLRTSHYNKKGPFVPIQERTVDIWNEWSNLPRLYAGLLKSKFSGRQHILKPLYMFQIICRQYIFFFPIHIPAMNACIPGGKIAGVFDGES